MKRATRDQSQLDRVAGATLADGVAAVRDGRLSASDWLDACLHRVRLCEPAVQAWASVDQDIARERAAELDDVDWSRRPNEPLLAGVPLGVKDIFNTIDFATEKGSPYWQGYRPNNDARLVARARWCGAVVMGKTTTAEFAVHEPSSTRNPHGARHISGTSSSGSAVAVACGMTPLAVGTQTAGSITRPASYNGVIGFKPSFGLVPRTGVLKTCDTLDTIGWFTRSVADARIALEAFRVGGHNHPNIERGFTAARARREGRGGWRLALAFAPGWEAADPRARERLVNYTRELGNRADIQLSELDLREPLAEAHEVHRRIYHKSLAYHFLRELRRPELVSERFRAVIDDGAAVSAADYADALDRQASLMRTLAAASAGHDALITLSVAGEAPLLDGDPEPPDTALVWTLCGAPTISLPLLRGDAGMPIGVQLVAPRYGDHALLDLAQSLMPEALEPVTPQANP